MVRRKFFGLDTGIQNYCLTTAEYYEIGPSLIRIFA